MQSIRGNRYVPTWNARMTNPSVAKIAPQRSIVLPDGLPEREQDTSKPEVVGSLTTRFFRVPSALLRATLTLDLTRDELLLYLLHCRGYNPKHRASMMGENAAHDRLWMPKKRWQKASGGLATKGLLMPLPTANARFPKTAVGSPLSPYPMGATAELDRPSLWDRQQYEMMKDEELIKMPWRLIDGASDATEPVLCEIGSVAGLRVVLSLYLAGRGDGLVPPIYAWMNDDQSLEHRLSNIDMSMDRVDTPDGLSEVINTGLVYPNTQTSRGRFVLWLFHPLEVPGDELLLHN